MRYLLLLALISLLVACTPPRPIIEHSNTEAANIKLSEAGNSVSHTLLELARMQAVATPPIRDTWPDPGINSMPEIASLDWSGPVGQLVIRIAEAAHYRVRILGNMPAIPIIVTITAYNTPLGNILRDAAYQANNRAHITLYPERRLIELRYAEL